MAIAEKVRKTESALPQDEKEVDRLNEESGEIEVEEQPDEADQRELDEARQRDLALTSVSILTSQDGVEPEEFAILRSAFSKIEEKIQWHHGQIALKQQEVQQHEKQISDLRQMLREKFKNLVDENDSAQSNNVPSASKRRGRPPGQRQKSRDGTSTGDLIAACLKATNGPLSNKQIIAFLEENKNTTNPSVELSRMVDKGMVERAGRGLYQWRHEQEQTT